MTDVLDYEIGKMSVQRELHKPMRKRASHKETIHKIASFSI